MSKHAKKLARRLKRLERKKQKEVQRVKVNVIKLPDLTPYPEVDDNYTVTKQGTNWWRRILGLK